MYGRGKNDISQQNVTSGIEFIPIQWLGLCACTAGGTGSIPGQGTKTLHVRSTTKKRKKQQQYKTVTTKKHKEVD